MASPIILQRSPSLTRQLGRCYLSSTAARGAYKSRPLLRNPATITTAINPTTSAPPTIQRSPVPELEVPGPRKPFLPRHITATAATTSAITTSTSTIHRRTYGSAPTMAANKEYALLCLENPLLGEFACFPPSVWRNPLAAPRTPPVRFQGGRVCVKHPPRYSGSTGVRSYYHQPQDTP